jgi:hypothetical protein
MEQAAIKANQVAHKLAQFRQTGWVECDGYAVDALRHPLLREEPQARFISEGDRHIFFLPTSTTSIEAFLKCQAQQVEETLNVTKDLLNQLSSLPRVSPFADSHDVSLCEYDIFCNLSLTQQLISVFCVFHIPLAEGAPRVWMLLDIGQLLDVPFTLDEWDEAAESGTKMYVEWEREGYQQHRLGSLQADAPAANPFIAQFKAFKSQPHPSFVQLRGACTSFFPNSRMAQAHELARPKFNTDDD